MLILILTYFWLETDWCALQTQQRQLHWAWYPILTEQTVIQQLLMLLTGPLFQLYIRPDLKSQMFGSPWHSRPCALDYWVWPLGLTATYLGQTHLCECTCSILYMHKVYSWLYSMHTSSTYFSWHNLIILYFILQVDVRFKSIFFCNG